MLHFIIYDLRQYYMLECHIYMQHLSTFFASLSSRHIFSCWQRQVLGNVCYQDGDCWIHLAHKARRLSVAFQFRKYFPFRLSSEMNIISMSSAMSREKLEYRKGIDSCDLTPGIPQPRESLVAWLEIGWPGNLHHTGERKPQYLAASMP